MFAGAATFNQDVGNWDVSSGLSFVSIIINIDITIYESTHLTHCLLLCQIILMYRITCLEEQIHLINTLAIGMCPIVETL